MAHGEGEPEMAMLEDQLFELNFEIDKMRDPSYVQALKGKGLNEEHQRKLYEMDLELLQIQSAMQRYRTYFF